MNDDLMSLPQARDAAQWWARLHAPDCTAAERAAFEDWLAAAPGNVEAWLQVEQADALAGELAGEDWLAAELARSQAGARQRRRRPWLRGGLAALAATLVLAVGIGYWQRGHETAAALRYAAAAGERRDLRLPDGTGLSLAPGAEVLARFDDRRRMVEVVRGQVQFVVGHDPRRPFEVAVGTVRVHDIGTVFQVVRDGRGGAVGLLEGAVEVLGPGGAKVALAPGQQVPIDGEGRLLDRQAFDLDVARGWPEGLLVFKAQRLDSLIREMNRYSDTPLQLADPALGARTVSGVFRAGDQQALVAALERGWALRATRQDGREVLVAR